MHNVLYDIAVHDTTGSHCTLCHQSIITVSVQDDILGSQFQVCEVDFAETGLALKSEDGQFKAAFECQECKALPPAPPTPIAPITPPSSDDAFQ